MKYNAVLANEYHPNTATTPYPKHTDYNYMQSSDTSIIITSEGKSTSYYITILFFHKFFNSDKQSFPLSTKTKGEWNEKENSREQKKKKKKMTITWNIINVTRQSSWMKS